MTWLRALSMVVAIAAACVTDAARARDALADPTGEMLAAGAAAARRVLPPGVLGERALSTLAAEVHGAMAGAAWRPIDTAPQDGRFLLFGLYRDGAFQYGIGCWQVDDAVERPGFWTVTDWFGAPPSHWMPLPAPP